MVAVSMETNKLAVVALILGISLVFCQPSYANFEPAFETIQAKTQPILKKELTPVVFWMVVEQDGDAKYIENDQQHQHVTQLQHAAQAYDLSVMLPMLDLSERVAVTEQDIAQFKWGVLQPASLRYNTETIVAGRLINFAGMWLCKWQIYDTTYPQVWESSGSDLNEQLALAVETVAAKLKGRKVLAIQQKAVTPGIQIRIKGITTLEAYGMVLQYLQSLDVAMSVEVNKLFGTEALFTIQSDVDRQDIAAAIAAEPILAAETGSVDNNQQCLEYRINL